MIMFGVLIRFPSSSGDGLRRAFSRRQARSEVAGVTCGKCLSCSQPGRLPEDERPQPACRSSSRPRQSWTRDLGYPIVAEDCCASYVS